MALCAVRLFKWFCFMGKSINFPTFGDIGNTALVEAGCLAEQGEAVDPAFTVRLRSLAADPWQHRRAFGNGKSPH